ncbi:MAG: polyprenol monophosphomannose synthase [Schleiferiaceae bacterium]|jgi:dolichol-phosphate mannosyltransferase|nr:MAG: dolichyl-phosphate beta-D-mannosyltransferase [Owenweeksia sp. TMED14]|tara:strand:+ start:7901 stop:8626 length:726 start_codon:yes stop_codon:yes gene_type:complete
MSSKSLIIIPTYNERENVNAIIDAILNLDNDFNLLIVDDNSPDGTADIVRGLQNRYQGRLNLESRKGKFGLGTAYIFGFKWALKRDYNFIFEMDADFSHDPNDLPKLLKACSEDNADLAIGSRYSNGVNVVNWPMSRVLLSYFASKYVRLITRMPIHDTTAGFKCYRRSVLEAIDFHKIRFTGYAFQIEMKFRTWKQGFKLKEVPVIFTDRKLGESKMSRGIIREAVFGVILLKIISFFKK